MGDSLQRGDAAARGLLERITVLALLGAVGVLVASFLFSMAVGPSLFFLTQKGVEASARSYHTFPLFLFFNLGVQIETGGVNGGLFFITLWGVFLICLAVALRGPGRGFVQAWRGVGSNPLRKAFENPLFSLPLIASMLLVALELIGSFQENVGVPTGNPLASISNPFILLVEASYAAVVEEVGFRLIPIGVVVSFSLLSKARGAIYSLNPSQRLAIVIRGFFHPEGAKSMLGVRGLREAGWFRGTRGWEWGIVLGGGVWFGFAHLVGGWGPGKVTEAFLVAVVMGLLYLYYGIHASILMHWFFNYHLVTLGIAYDLGPPPLSGLAEFLYLSIYAVGIGGGIVFAAVAARNYYRSRNGGEPPSQNPLEAPGF